MSSTIHDLEQQLATAPTTRAKIDALNSLAWEIRRHEPKRCIELCQEALALAGDEDLVSRATSLNHAGFAHFILRELDQAHECCLKAIELYEQADQLEGQPQAYSTLGITYQEIGDFIAAQKMYLRQLQIARELQDQWHIAYALQRMGVVYDLIGDYDGALAHYAQSLAIYETINDRNGQASIYNNLAITHQNLDDYGQALTYANKALQLFTEMENPFGQARIRGNLAELLAHQGQHEQAFEHAKQSLEMAIDSQRKEAQAVGWLSLARVYNITGRAKQAVECLRESLQLATEIDSIHLKYQCHEQLAKAYEQLEHFAWALHHFEKFHVLKKEALDEQSRAKLYQLDVYYQTEQAHQEAERQKLLRKSEQAHYEHINRLKDELIFATSHDLKNPLSNIIGLAELNLELDDLNTESTREDLRSIVQQAEVMIELISDVLDLATLETRQALTLRPVELRKLTNETVLAHRAHAQHKAIDLSIVNTLPEDTKILADEIGLRRVIGNVVSNAIKYTPDGGKVTIKLEQNGSGILIHVVDTGFGIPASDLPNIFERFYRVTALPHRNIEGTGLGLAIAQLITQQHGGQIEVESTLGKGSTFTIHIPAIKVKSNP